MFSFLEYFIKLEEDYKTAKTKFLADKGSEEDIVSTIDTFKKIQNRLTGDEKNIDWWAKQGWTKFEAFVKEKATQPNKSSLKKNAGDFITILDNDKWLIVVPLDHLASCYYGSGTDWCTTKTSEGHFSNHVFEGKETLVYCLNKIDITKKLAIDFFPEDLKIPKHYLKYNEPYQIFDIKDEEIDKNEFKKISGLTIEYILELLAPHKELISKKKKENKTKDLYILLKQIKKGQPNLNLENLIIAKEDSRSAYDYVKKVYNKYYPKLEPTIAKNILFSLKYAMNILKGQFKLGEPIISKDISAVLYYVNYTKKVFTLGETTILNGLINKRFQEQELDQLPGNYYFKFYLKNDHIKYKKDIGNAICFYAIHTNTRFLKGENFLIKNNITECIERYKDYFKISKLDIEA